MKITEMTTEALITAARKYSQDEFGGAGEGYNPYERELDRRQQARLATSPRGIVDVLADLNRVDNAIARESGTFDADRAAALNAELEAIEVTRKSAEKEKDDAWTLEVTQARRIEWNAATRAQIGSRRSGSAADFKAIQTQVGFEMSDLKEAIKRHSL